MTDNSKNSTSILKIVCAISFLTFTFCYLYFYQADILAVGQHVLSGGATHYNTTIGAILITLTLFLLQVGVYALTKLERRAHALTYFPSLLVLTLITDVSPRIDERFSFGAWLWVFPLLLILYAVFVWMYRKYLAGVTVDAGKGFFSRPMWINLLTLAVMFFLVCTFSNHDDVFHYRMRAESCLIKGDFQGASRQGEKSLSVDSSLTMIRAYALAKQGLLGERMFEYPVVGGSDALLPNGTSVKMMMYPVDDMYKSFGLKIKQKLSPRAYFDFLARHHRANKMDIDYLLTACLMDRDLASFAKLIPQYYKIDENLPRYYKEALVLYTHSCSNPVLVYHDSVKDTDFQDYQKLYYSIRDEASRMVKLRDNYGDTYWYYYQESGSLLSK